MLRMYDHEPKLGYIMRVMPFNISVIKSYVLKGNATFQLPACPGVPTVFLTVNAAGSTIGTSTGTTAPTGYNTVNALSSTLPISLASSTSLASVSSTLSSLSASSVSSASPTSTSSVASTLTWESCSWGQDANLQCATLLVPLDYTLSVSKRADSTTNNTMELPLFRVPATSSTPRNQSILFNPGGPGGSGVKFVYDSWQQWVRLFGNDFDLIGFDPRGVNNTIPFSCTTPTLSNNATFWTRTTAAIQAILDINTEVDSACLQSSNVAGNLFGTTFVARDMMQIVDALGEDGLLRYVGISYGTVLGDTVAAMFPDRMDKLILDGNVNPVDWYHGDLSTSFLDTNAALDGYFAGCHAAPGSCLLADASNMTGPQLEQQYVDYLQADSNSNLTLDPVTVGEVFFHYLYSPDHYRSFSGTLQLVYNTIAQGVGLQRRSYSDLKSHHHRHEQHQHRHSHSRKHWKRTNPTADPDFLFRAVTCGDGMFGGTQLTVSDMESILANYSPYAGTLYLEVLASNAAACSNWPVKAKEVYTGDFNVQTNRGIFYINSPYDPITPYASAQNASSLFSGSVLLQHVGYGHSSLADYSTCTLGYYRSYMRNGTLPSAGTICQANLPLFSNATVDAFSSDDYTDELEGVGQDLQDYWTGWLSENSMLREIVRR